MQMIDDFLVKQSLYFLPPLLPFKKRSRDTEQI